MFEFHEKGVENIVTMSLLQDKKNKMTSGIFLHLIKQYH